jgi:chemotaxis protein MotB
MVRKIGIVAALLLVGTTGCVSSSKYETKSKEAAANATKAEENAAKAAAMEKKAAELEKQLAEARQQAAAVEQARNELQAKAATLAQEKSAAEAKSAQYEKLAGSLQTQIKAGQIEVSELRGKMTVKLKDKVLFPSGSARLNKEGSAALDVVAGVFKDLKGKNVVVAGYTDNVRVAAGSYKDNWELSTARAVSVVRYLASKGVPPEMLGAAGFSEFRPVAPNDTPANRSLNRRIEIALTAAEEAPVVETPKR